MNSAARRTGAAVAATALMATAANTAVAAGDLSLIGPIAVNGGHAVFSRAYMSYAGGNMDEHHDVREWEVMPAWDTVCNYQGYVHAVFPNGNVAFSQFSGLNSGCSFFIALRDFSNWNGLYPSCTKIMTKWKSDNTPGGTWLNIGLLKPQVCYP